MERRKFIEICALSSASACAGEACAQAAASNERIKVPGQTPAVPKRSGVVLKATPHTRVKLVDADGRAILAKSLKPNHNYVFQYPFESTPCFLLNLDRSVAQSIELLTEKGDAYQWSGGVGSKKNIVAFSAICAHKLAYPSPQVSFISYRHKPSPIHVAGNIIGCCADKSVYDPAQGAQVLSGPAPQPLAGILLEHDVKTDQLFAIGTVGGEMFEAFFKKYEFKLALEKSGARAKERVTGTTVLRDLSAHSQQTAQC